MYKKISYLTVIISLLLSLSSATAQEIEKSSLAMPAIISFLLTDENNLSVSKAYKIFGITNYDPNYYDDGVKRYSIHDNYTLLGEFSDIELKNIDVNQYSGFAIFVYDKSYKIDLLNLDYSNIYTTQSQTIIIGNIDINYDDFLGEFHNQDDGKVASPNDFVDGTIIGVIVFTTYDKNTLNIKFTH